MPQERDVAQVEGDQHVVQILGEARDLVAVVDLFRLAMAAHVERDGTIAAAQAGCLMLELRRGLRPSRDHQERRAGTGLDVAQMNPVAGHDLRLLRLGCGADAIGRIVVAISAAALAVASTSRRVMVGSCKLSLPWLVPSGLGRIL